MISTYKEYQDGFEDEADVVVIGSGAGGAVCAENFVNAGYNTILLEAGPPAGPAAFDHHAANFMADHYWEGGLRLTGGTASQPMLPVLSRGAQRCAMPY